MARLRGKKRVTKAKASATELVRCFCNKYGCNGDLTARSTCRRHAASDFQLAEELGSASNLPSLFSDPNSTGDPDDLPDLPEAVEEYEDPLTNPLDELFDCLVLIALTSACQGAITLSSSNHRTTASRFGRFSPKT